MTCTSCGAAIDAGRKFCLECGAGLAAACPSCGAPNPPAAKFCGECGGRIGGPPASIAPATGAAPTSSPAATAVAERRLVGDPVPQ